MISRINDPAEFDQWKNRDIFTVRILGLLESYGCKYDFASYYKQVTDGEITAVMSKLDGDFTLSLNDNADTEELLRFFCVTGYNSITCSNGFAIGARFEEGEVMYCDKKLDFTLGDAVLDEYPKLMDLFNFVDYNSQDFKSWYVDISHRVRHNTAKAYTLCRDGVIISSGILSSVIDGYALLTAVRTEPEYRGEGYGSALVSAICNDVSGRVYIMREAQQNEHFYKELGFINCGKWRIYR